MTRLLEQAVEAVSALPDEAQDDLARILLQLAGVDQPPYELTPEEAAEYNYTPAEKEFIKAWTAPHVSGCPGIGHRYS